MFKTIMLITILMFTFGCSTVYKDKPNTVVIEDKCDDTPIDWCTPKVVELNNLKIVQASSVNELKNLCNSSAAIGCYKRNLHMIVIREIKTEYDIEVFQDLGHEINHAIGSKHSL